jgi:adenine-specific DNA-methyltransferase
MVKGEIVPLLWAHNFDGTGVNYKKTKLKKPTGIRVNKYSLPLLVPVRNYVLLKRFSSKEQNKRLHAVVLLKETFPFKYVGLENHLNFIHKYEKEMSKEEAFGIATLLNSSIADNYFRSLNGNTQVNAVEIRCLPFPSIENLVEIGRQIQAKKSVTLDIADEVVFSILQLDNKLISMYKESC